MGTLGITTVADGIRLVDRSVYVLDDDMLPAGTLRVAVECVLVTRLVRIPAKCQVERGCCEILRGCPLTGRLLLRGW